MDTKFIKPRESNIYYFTTFTEILLSVITFYLAAYIREYFFPFAFAYTREYQILMLIMIFSWFFLLRTKNFEKFHRTKSYSAIFVEYAKGILLGAAILTTAIFVFKLNTISRGFILLFTSINFIVLYVFRISFYAALKHYRTQGRNQKNVVIIGDETSENVIDKIIQNREWGLNIVKIISNSKYIYNKYHMAFNVIPEEKDLHRILELDIIDEVIFYKNNIDQKELSEIIYSCEEVGVVFQMYSECWNITGRKYHISHFGDMPYFTFMNKPSDSLALYMKDIMDYSMAIIMSILLLPVFTIISVAIKLESEGPVFFKQERVGLRGRKFFIYKFRTMVNKAEQLRTQIAERNEMDGPVFKIKDDPRITRIGKFLRKTGLDELPQIFNIIHGDMSFIGPRPPIQEEVEQYERWQLRRLSMKPGITCIWQTMPNRNEIFFNNWMRLDLQYIDSWSLKLDFILFIKTFRTIIRGSGR
jgi:exopolysaccharide biosynthesis polyprenyl glycosylphosphotransferase